VLRRRRDKDEHGELCRRHGCSGRAGDSVSVSCTWWLVLAEFEYLVVYSLCGRESESETNGLKIEEVEED
jgi:hypothetical protein